MEETMIEIDEAKPGDVLVYQMAPMANKHFVMAVNCDLIRIPSGEHAVMASVLFSQKWERGIIKDFNPYYLDYSTLMEAALYEENGV